MRCLRVIVKESVQSSVPGALAGNPLHLASDCSIVVSLADRGGFFVRLTATRFGKYARTLAGTSKTPQNDVKGFVLSNLDSGHMADPIKNSRGVIVHYVDHCYQAISVSAAKFLSVHLTL